MPFEHHNEKLNSYPNIVPLSEQREQLTLGDLHANALLLFRTLIKYGIFEVSPEDFSNYARIYMQYAKDRNSHSSSFFSLSDKAFMKENLETLIQITQRARSSSSGQGRLVRLLGDELADRGVCDYLILIIIERMANENIPYEIIISNHALEFLRAFQEYFKVDNPGGLLEATKNNKYLASSYPAQYRSLDTLLQLIDKGYLEKSSFTSLVTRYYLPRLKLASYALKPAESTIRIFTHAPIDLSLLRTLANKFDTPYEDRTIQDLAKLIDSINDIFKAQIEDGVKITSLFPPQTVELVNNTRNITSVRYLKENINCAFAWLTWNRRISGILSALTGGDYKILFVHGHHHSASQKTQTEVQVDNVSWSSLDSMYGKEETEAISSEQHILLSLEIGSQDAQEIEEKKAEPKLALPASDTDSASDSEDKKEVSEPARKRPRK